VVQRTAMRCARRRRIVARSTAKWVSSGAGATTWITLGAGLVALAALESSSHSANTVRGWSGCKRAGKCMPNEAA